MRALPQETRDHIDKLERKHAENPEGRYFVPLANALRKAGDTTHAKQILEEGIEKHPDYVSAHIVLARCLQDDGEADAAEARFEHVLTLDPQNLVALRAMGELATRSRRTDDARRWYALLLDVDPMNEEAKEALDHLVRSPVVDAEDDQFATPSVAHDVGTASSTTPIEASGADSADGFSDEWEDAPQPFPPATDVFTPPPADGVLASDEGGDLIEHPMNDPRAFRLDDGNDDIFGDEGSVVTETIAELYVRQGFYDRAAKVYRELIRRRGADENLEQRLARVERLAAGLPDLDPAISGDDSAAVESGADTEDPFADSFIAGFPSIGEGETGELGEDAPADDRGFDEAKTRVDESEEPADPSTSTIREYLRSVLTWTPAPVELESSSISGYSQPHESESSVQSAVMAEAGDESVAQPDGASSTAGEKESPAEEPDFVEGYAWADRTDVPPLADLTHGHDPAFHEEAGSEDGRLSWDEPEISSTSDPDRRAPPEPPPSPAGPWSSSADDDLFPWELPTSPTAEQDRAQVGDVIPDDEATAAAPSERASMPEPEVEHPRDPFVMDANGPADTPSPSDESSQDRDGEDDDDDLESFQAWLRSLKR